jgi:hypothetical protein
MATPKIYRLECNDGHFYIGSTSKSLTYRKAQHVQTSLRGDSRGNKVYSHIHKIGWDNVKIVLVQDVPPGADYRKIEDAYIRASLSDPLCLNKNRAFTTAEEKAAAAREFARKVQERRNAPIVCECGLTTTVGRHRQHLNSYKHRKIISAQDRISEDDLDSSDSESQQEQEHQREDSEGSM